MILVFWYNMIEDAGKKLCLFSFWAVDVIFFVLKKTGTNYSKFIKTVLSSFRKSSVEFWYIFFECPEGKKWTDWV